MKQIKKKYEKPQTKVYQLQIQSQLLQLSGPGDYGNGGDPFNNPLFP